MIFGFKESGLWNMTLNIHLFKMLKMSRKEQSRQMLEGFVKKTSSNPKVNRKKQTPKLCLLVIITVSYY